MKNKDYESKVKLAKLEGEKQAIKKFVDALYPIIEKINQMVTEMNERYLEISKEVERIERKADENNFG